MKKINILFLSIFTLFALILSSCTIGLGEAVDMEAPEVSISSPENFSSIPQTFKISGNVKDNFQLKYLQVEVSQDSKVIQKYKLEELKWYVFSNGSWSPYENKENKVTGDKLSVAWTLALSLSKAQSGTDYVVTAYVYDQFDNQGKKSKDTITVTVDAIDPVVSVSSPVLLPSENLVSDFNALKAEDIKDVSKIGSFQNKDFTIKGNVREDSEVKSLTIYLDSETTSSVDISSADFNPIIKKTVSGDLRNWNISINKSDFTSSYQTGKHLIRVISESTDSAGNIEVKVLGWLIYWNEADIPWIVPDFSGVSESDEFTIRTSYLLRGSAYDDDGLKKVIAKLYTKVGEATDYSAEPVKTYEIPVNNGVKNTKWECAAPEFICHFYIEFSCIDIYGNVSAVEKRYCYVNSITPPDVTFTYEDGTDILSNSNSLCNSEGKVTLAGKVTNSEKIVNVKIVRIAEGNENTKISYSDPADPVWNLPASGNKTSNGNLIWEILNAQTVPPAAVSTFNTTSNLYEYSFSKDFNLFGPDLNIRNSFPGDGKEKLGNQLFIVRAENESGNSSIKEYTLLGDNTSPTITIDRITAGSNHPFTIDNVPPALKSVKTGESITIEGHWDDNSFAKFDNENYLNFEISGLNFAAPVIDKTNKKWSATYTVKSTDDIASVSVSAKIEDLAGNNSTNNFTFFFDNNKPQFMGYNSDSSGTYGAGEVIPVYMEFNREITVIGTPELTLSNGGTATFDAASNGTNKLKFNYTVASSNNSGRIYVSGLTQNLSWKDSSGNEIQETDMQMFKNTTTSQSLYNRKNITIDTSAPKIDGINFITAAGSYKALKQIIIQVEFNEEVNLTDANELKLKLNSAENAYAVCSVKNSSKYVNFTYNITDGHTASNLSVESFSYTGSIKDAYGNSNDSTKTISSSILQAQDSGIIIDTTGPDTPKINTLVNNKIYYADQSFTIDFKESNGTKEYSLDNGASWTTYTSAVTLSNNQDYFIVARQIDAAGNESNHDSLKVTMDKGNCLESITVDYPNGTCRSGTIPINLNFRKPVYFSSAPTIKINIKNGDSTQKELTCVSASGSRKLTFNYKVSPGDSTPTSGDIQKLYLISDSFSGILYDSDEDYKSEIPVGFDPSLLTADIKIETSAPIATLSFKQIGDKINEDGGDGDVNKYTNPTLIISFSKKINKNRGNIVITQDAAKYKAPAYLSDSEYNKYKSAIENYYERTTNGCDAITGKPFTEEKWILKYEYSTANNSAVSQALIKAKAHVIEIPVASEKVSVSSDKKTLTIPLTDAYALGVKGAKYTINLPQSFVCDDNGEPNTEKELEVTLNGKENPVIRVNKGVKEKVSPNSQPDFSSLITTTAKIDCQTPDAIIYYKKRNKETTDVELVKISENSTVVKMKQGQTIFDVTTTPNDTPKSTDSYFTNISWISSNILSSTANTDGDKLSDGSIEISLGDSNNAISGYKCLIGAKTVDGQEIYESAMKTVIYLKENNNKTYPSGDYDYRWIRGGDAQNGGISSSDVNFPYSWNTSEFTKVRAMKETNSSSGEYYWITWDLTMTSYVMFLAGDMPADVALNGPSKWWWSSCGWTQDEDDLPVYPGEKTIYSFAASDKYGGTAYLEDNGKHKEYRDGSSVISVCTQYEEEQKLKEKYTKKYRFTNSSTDYTEKETGIWGRYYNIVITFNPIAGFSGTSYLRLDYKWGKSELEHTLTQNEINGKTYTFTVNSYDNSGNISRIEAYGVEVTSVKVDGTGYTFIDN